MRQEKKSERNMTVGAPGKALFMFALPMIIGNLFQQFYHMADSVIVGRFVGEEALAAVGASYALTTVFVMLAIGGGTGCAVVTSQCLGAGEYGRLKISVSTALLGFAGVSLALAIGGFLGSGAILIALKTPDNILKAARLYLKIYFCGLPFLFMYNILAAMFHSLGDSRTPLYLLIFSSVFNVVLDILFVTQFQLGVAGVAVATVLAQGISAFISLGLLLGKLQKYPAEQDFCFFDYRMAPVMLRVALPTMLQQSIVSVGMLLVQSVVNGYGSSVLAGYTAGARVESICIVPMIAMGNAMSTFTAQNMGARQIDRVRYGYKAACKLVVVFAAIICLLLSFGKRGIVGMFMEEGQEAQAWETGVAYLSFIAFFFLWIGLKAITDGVLRGCGDMWVFTLANLANLTIRVSVAKGCAPLWGVAAVWYAVPMGWAVNYIISLCRYLTGKWKEKTLLKDIK